MHLKEIFMRPIVLLAACFGLFSAHLQAGVIDPDCDAGKAVKSAAMKATVGVGGRCSPKEALTDSAGIEAKKDQLSNSKETLKDGKKQVKDTVNQPTNSLIKKAVN
jgi:hypothetical protein